MAALMIAGLRQLPRIWRGESGRLPGGAREQPFARGWYRSLAFGVAGMLPVVIIGPIVSGAGDQPGRVVVVLAIAAASWMGVYGLIFGSIVLFNRPKWVDLRAEPGAVAVILRARSESRGC